MAKRKKVKARGAKRMKSRARTSSRPAKRKAARKKVMRKKTARAPKKVVKRKVAKKAPARKMVTKPKLPRRTPQAAPPPPPPPPPPVAPPAPVVDVEPMAPMAPPPPPRPSGTMGETTLEEEVSPTTTGPAGRVPQVGEMAPDFDLPDQTGRRHSLAQYRGRKVVLYFYPKDDTSGCTAEACGFRDALGSFDARNAVVLGISPDPVDSHQRFAQKYSLTFPLLADEGHRVAEQYGVWVAKQRYGTTSMGIGRTTFVIGPDGRIAHVFKNVHPEGHEAEVLQTL